MYVRFCVLWGTGVNYTIFVIWITCEGGMLFILKSNSCPSDRPVSAKMPRQRGCHKAPLASKGTARSAELLFPSSQVCVVSLVHNTQRNHPRTPSSGRNQHNSEQRVKDNPGPGDSRHASGLLALPWAQGPLSGLQLRENEASLPPPLTSC